MRSVSGVEVRLSGDATKSAAAASAATSAATSAAAFAAGGGVAAASVGATRVRSTAGSSILVREI